jgi:hypothetical protein
MPEMKRERITQLPFQLPTAQPFLFTHGFELRQRFGSKVAPPTQHSRLTESYRQFFNSSLQEP